MEVMFNRMIDVELIGETGVFVIKTPIASASMFPGLWCRKPHIEVHGLLYGRAEAMEFELRVVNMYNQAALGQFNRVRVTAGYFNNASMCLEGCITLVYTENPGPDRVTVIKCVCVDIDRFMNGTANVNADVGATIQDVLNQISDGIGFKAAPKVDPTITEVAASPVYFNGMAKDILPILKTMWPGVTITVINNQIIAYKEVPTTGRLIQINQISTPCHYTGGLITVNAPWNPDLKPGDRIVVPNLKGLGTQTYAAYVDKQIAKRSVYKVTSVQFDFATTGNMNKMIVTGV